MTGPGRYSRAEKLTVSEMGTLRQEGIAPSDIGLLRWEMLAPSNASDTSTYSRMKVPGDLMIKGLIDVPISDAQASSSPNRTECLAFCPVMKGARRKPRNFLSGLDDDRGIYESAIRALGRLIAALARGLRRLEAP